jgi:hypothetical protein
MNVLVNKGRRRLGISGRPALILNADEAVKIGDDQLAEISKNRTVARWLESGVLCVMSEQEYDAQNHAKTVVPKQERPRPARRTRPPKKDDRKVEPLPDGVTGEGFEIHHSGGGWYQVFVNGFKVTDRNVRKDEAVAMEDDYDIEKLNPMPDD